ncbi:hypothetical protein [Streptomyces sp. NPDC057910]|uniref:hypothetical protein n=1 Tax=Streptomyces sp. NPDC057910 TaxID=3346278 RepID=UPI0036EE3DA2
MKKKPALAEALTGQFEDHHGRLLGVLLGTVDHLTAQVRELDRLIAELMEQTAAPHDGAGTGPPHTDDTGTSSAHDGVTAREPAERLDTVPGIGPATAQIISPRSAWT